MEKIKLFEKVYLKAIKFLILLISSFGKKQSLLNNLLVWLNIQQGKNAPIDNEMEVKFVSKFLEKNKDNLLIDVGGFEGKYTDELLKYFPESHITIFEPSYEKYLFLTKKFQNNPKVKIENFATSNFSGNAKLYSNNTSDTLATLNRRKDKNRGREFLLEEEIEVIRLSDYWKKVLKNKNIDLLKLDIEGTEIKVIEDIKNNLDKIHLIQFEFGEANIGSRTFFKDFWDIFNENNFLVYRYTHKNFLIEIKEYTEYDEFFRYTNYIAINQNFKNINI